MIGEHDGLWFYTLGQRHGLDIGGAGEAWYVAKKDMSGNVLYVVQGHNNPALMRWSARGSEPHWIAGNKPSPVPITCAAKIRYRQSDQPCRLWYQNKHSIEVQFDYAQRAITPGQSVVFYDGEVVLGGATISARDDATATKN